MARYQLVPRDRTDIAPLTVTPRLRGQLVYFIAAPDAPGHPDVLQENEYFFARADIAVRIDEGVFYLISPLDTNNLTEVEITEEQETMLNWLHKHDIQHILVVEIHP